jgi:hypothetical protein
MGMLDIFRSPFDRPRANGTLGVNSDVFPFVVSPSNHEESFSMPYEGKDCHA